MNIYNPSASERRFLGIEPFYWLYATGIEIVGTYGDVFPRKMRHDVSYLMISRTEEIDPQEVIVMSDKWGRLRNGKVFPECLEGDAWRHVRNNYKYCGQPVKINGKKFIIAYPYTKKKIPFLYSRSTGRLFPVLRLAHTSNPKLSKVFKVMDKELGDWSKYYSEDIEELVWQDLNIVPCGEFAHSGLIEYCISRGYDIKAQIQKLRSISNKRTYMLLKRHLDKGEKLIVIPNRWELKGNTYSRWEPWMDEDNSITRMIGFMQYTGCRGMLGGHRCMIITFPPRIYNPIIWDVDANTVFMLPSKAYPGERYYKQIVSHFGEIY